MAEEKVCKLYSFEGSEDMTDLVRNQPEGAYTAGPWTTDPRGRVMERCITTVDRINNHKVPIAIVDDDYNFPLRAEQRANIALICAAPDLLEALIKVRAIIVDAAMTGFNCHEGDWAERLFASQADSAAAVRKACPGAERTKVSSQASGHERVEPKQEINPSNGDEQP